MLYTGHTWDYVVVTCVRTAPESVVPVPFHSDWQQQRLGLCAEPHILYTALTRARKGFVFIGKLWN